MAAPTSVRVEAFSQTDTQLYWVYPGSASIGIYRSPDGVTYALIDSVGSGALTYNNSFLTAGTKYWYKLSDDGGSTFSSVVTVWTHVCGTPPGEGADLQLPRADKDIDIDAFNLAMERLEQMNISSMGKDPCVVCVDDGRVIIDCSSGCCEFYVDVTEDINSISLLYCSNGGDGQAASGCGGNVSLFVPANVSRGICGWPVGAGFGGDECFRSPISGGAFGRTVSVGVGPGGSGSGSGSGAKSRSGSGGMGGGGGGGGSLGGCECVPGKNNALAIKACTDGNSLGCSSTNKRLRLIACGGRSPYSWSHTGSVKFQGVAGDHSTDTDTKESPKNTFPASVVIVPPVNSGSAVAGNAYTKQAQYCDDGAQAILPLPAANTFGCNDQVTITSTCSGASVCSGVGSVLFATPPASGICAAYKISSTPVECQNQDGICDVRTAPMIAAGCVPCGVAAGASTVSVTDANGTVVTITLTP